MATGSVSAYSVVQATTRALYSTLLEPETWSALKGAEDLDAALTTLSKTAYGPYLEIAREELTPRRTVYQLRWHLAKAYEKLIRLTPEPGRLLLLQLWRLYEVDNLKAVLRGIETGASWYQVRHVLAPMTRFITLSMPNLERMLESGSIAGAIERTRGTPYYDTLTHARARYETEHSLFPLEAALDLGYRRGLWQSIDGLNGKDHEQAMRLVGSLLDADNLLWAIRYRVYHHLSEQEIINYTLPLGHRVRDDDIRAIASGMDIVEVVRGVYPDILGLAPVGDEPGEALTDLERSLQMRLAALCHAAFVGEPFHLGLPIAYLLLSENEIRNLTTLIEAKSSQLPVERFESLLVV